MAKEITKYNLERDKNVLGKKWLSTYNNYFSDEQNIQIFIDSVKPSLPKKELDILYVASASGLLGEKLVSTLGKGRLTIVDISQKHLDENTNTETTKICADLLEMDLGKQFDLIIMRSSLDYFPSEELQIKVLKIIKRHLKKDGLFINQPCYIPTIEKRNLLTEIYNSIDKIGDRFFQSTDMDKIYKKAGLTKPQKIGDGKTMYITERGHTERYELTDNDIKKIQSIIKADSEYAKITKGGYELRFDFPIFLSK